MADEKQAEVPAKDEDKTVLDDEMPKFEISKTFVLSKSVDYTDDQGKAGVLKQITLRFPTGYDLLEVGGPPSPTKWIKDSMIVEIDPERSKAWLSRLSGVSIQYLYKIPARDMRAMLRWINTEINSGN